MLERVFWFCKGCKRGAVLDKGVATGTCGTCGSEEWETEDEVFSEPTEFEVSLMDKRFLKSIRISPD